MELVAERLGTYDSLLTYNPPELPHDFAAQLYTNITGEPDSSAEAYILAGGTIEIATNTTNLIKELNRTLLE